MSDSNADPEKYSIDEMLERLKSRGEGEGELVTRADGTKAIKVRKRKRRTEQTRDKLKAHNQRMQLFQIVGFIVFIFAMLILGGILMLYANSSSFREDLITKIGKVAGSEVKLLEFRMSPATASAAYIEMDWPESHALHHLDARTIKAKIAPISFVGKIFTGQEIVADHGKLLLTAPKSAEGIAKESSSDAESLIRFNRYSINKLNVFFSREEDWSRMIEKVEASYLPASKGGEIRLNSGQLKMTGWPDLEMERSYIKVNQQELDVVSMRFHVPPSKNQKIQHKGSIELTGVLNPMKAGETHSLFVNLESFPISPLLGEGLGRFFSGHTLSKADENSNVLKFTPGSGQDATLELKITNSLDSRMSLAQFKFLGFLAMALEDRWYELPSFEDEVQISLLRSGASIEVKDIFLEQHTRMIVKGSLSTKDDGANISGKLSVGIPEIIIAASKNRRLDKIFGPVKEGYRWIELNISGSGSAPVDDFKDRYVAAVVEGQTEVAPPKNKPEGVDSFDSLIETK